MMMDLDFLQVAGRRCKVVRGVADYLGSADIRATAQLRYD